MPETRGRVDVSPELVGQLPPALQADDGDLTTTRVVGVATDPLICDEDRVRSRIHRAAMRALQPDPLQPSIG